MPAFLYMRATLEERRGACKAAIGLYRAFLREDIPEVDAQAARAGLRRCGASPEVPEPEVAPPQSIPAAGPTAPAPSRADPMPEPTPVSDPPKRRWYADPAGGVLVGVGTAVLGAGIGVYAQGSLDERAALEASDLEGYEQLAPRAERLGTAGIALLSIGPAILIGAVIRYAVVARKGGGRSNGATRITADGTHLRIRY